MDTQKLAELFCSWKLPKTVCADKCACDPNYGFERSGTNLLTVSEAKQFFDYLASSGHLTSTNRLPQPAPLPDAGEALAIIEDQAYWNGALAGWNAALSKEVGRLEDAVKFKPPVADYKNARKVINAALKPQPAQAQEVGRVNEAIERVQQIVDAAYDRGHNTGVRTEVNGLKQLDVIRILEAARLYAAQPATPQRSEGETVAISKEAYDFLTGRGPMKGVWFGEKPKENDRSFWWRTCLLPKSEGVK